MKKIKFKKENIKEFQLLVFLFSFFFLLFNISSAQSEPQFWVTWSAKSYVPQGYPGKILPTVGSEIQVSFELIEAGRPLDIGGQNVYWYLNDKLVESGLGIKSLKIYAPPPARNIMRVRIQLPDFRSEIIVKTIEIPVVPPEAVIYAPYPKKEFQETVLKLRAKPFFYKTESARNLNFSWKVNGEEPSELDAPEFLIVNLKGIELGARVRIDLDISNPASREAARSTAELIFVK